MSKGLIFITGASGFIGSATALEALKAGYRLRVCLRRPADYLRTLFSKYSQQVEYVFILDLTDESAFRDKLDGVDFVLHLASPLPHGTNKETYFTPAVKGTTALLKAATKVPSIKKVVVTSSMAALVPLAGIPDGGVIHENNDWDFSVDENGTFEDPANPSATPMVLYMASKLLANTATWDFWKASKPHYALVTLHPAFVYGHNLMQTSADGIQGGSNGALWGFIMGGYPVGFLTGVHVRDVAEAHIRTLNPKIADGSKYLLAGKGITVPEIAQFIQKRYPDVGAVVTEDSNGVLDPVDTTKAETELGMNWRSFESMVQEVVDQQLSFRKGSQILSDGNMKIESKEPEKGEEFIEDIDATIAEQRIVTRNDSLDVEEFSPDEQRRIIHKVDRRLSLVLLVFFIPYVLVQLPANAIAQKISPRNFSCALAFSWGFLMVGAAFVDKWWNLLIIRALLGAFESSLFAALLPLLSSWYTRYDVHKRFSIGYFISCLIAALGPVLACGFMQMDGLRGLAGWRWIFLMEGVLNFAAAIVGWLLLVEYPLGSHKCWGFLTEKEEAYIIRHIDADRADATEQTSFNIRDFLRPAKDWKVFTYPTMFLLATCVSYSIAFFLPIILEKKLHYGVTAAQGLSTPPYVAAGLWMYLTAWFGDKYHLRGPIVISNCLLSITGLALLGWVASPGVQYFGVILVTAGANATIPTDLAWQANNIRGRWTRAFCNALLLMGGGIGGIVGSLVFRSQDAPTYRPGIAASIVASLITMVIAIALMLRMHRLNKMAAAGAIVLEDLPGFRYTL
ncbi:hypothetical protein FE257_010797 [Aspergillus nanangensis]|uniref:NAD-dependent epimerase/dehydratase domain-containing protein n=1 Tax=Aspergillus nanangensis TaxID=2582783 RepID=A0AAD4GY79_ASPNN|nr:hypothetical protein FE257_010797 [Aspergillus nanangensis]